MKRYTKIVLITWGVMALAGGMYMLVKGQEDPREKVLGEWEEKSSKVRVEVVPGEIRWRGMGHGKARYEWVQYEEEPYRVHSKIRGQEWNVDLRFSGEDIAIAEPDIWDHLSDEAKEMLRDVNRQHGRPEREFRLIFKRVENHERK